MTVGLLKNSNELIQAIFRRSYDDCLRLVNPISANYQDKQRQSVLHAAAHCGDVRIVELLLREGALVNVTDSRWLTALHRACASGSADVVRLLLGRDADRNARDKSWRTPLHLAATYGHLECARLLLAPSDWTTNVNASDRLGHTALHHAICSGHVDMIRLLLKQGASINAFDKRDRRVMHWAAVYGRNEIVELLAQSGAEVNCHDRDHFTPLHVAAAVGHAMTVKCLIGLGADLMAVTARGNTPLHIACLNGHDEVVAILLEAIGNTAAPPPGLSATEPSAQTESARLEAISTAVSKMSESDRLTPIHLAVSSTGGAECLLLLLEACSPRTGLISTLPGDLAFYRYLTMAAVSAPGGMDNSRPLHFAALHGRSDRSRLLLKYGAAIDVVDKWGNTALHIAADRGHELFVRDLLHAGCPWSIRGHLGSTALHRAAMSGYQACLLRLLAAVSSGKKDQSGACTSPDHLDPADIMNSDTTVEAHERLRKAVEMTDNDGRSLMHAAALGSNTECLKVVLLAGADPFHVDSRGWTPLHYTVASCSLALRESASQSTNSLYDQWSYRANAISDASVASLVFLKLGADVNAADQSGCTPLHLACAFDTSGVLVGQLIQRGADIFKLTAWPPSLSTSDSTQEFSIPTPRYSPLHLAVARSNVAAVRDLLSSCPVDLSADYIMGSLNKSDYSGPPPNSPFLLAASSDNEEIFELLLITWGTFMFDSDGDDVNPTRSDPLPGQICDDNGRTALHLAASKGSIGICKLLLNPVNQSGASVFTKDSVFRWNALHHAASQGHTDIVNLLLDCEELRVADKAQKLLHEVDEHGRTALMLAVQENHVEVVRLLVQLDAQEHRIDAADVFGRTAFHRAVANGYEACAELLLEHGADPSVQDFRQRQALHMAATAGHMGTLAITLRHLIQLAKDRGYEPASRSARDLLCPMDQSGFTPLHLAAYCGHSDCIEALLNVACYEHLRGHVYTPIHCAAQNGHVGALKLLLNLYGTNYLTVQDCKKRTALHIAALTNQVNCLEEIVCFMEFQSRRPSNNTRNTDVVNDPKKTLAFASFILQLDADGRSALMLAVLSGSQACAERLLDLHTNLSVDLWKLCSSDSDKDHAARLLAVCSLGAADRNGQTALHLACRAPNEETGLLILNRIEDINVINQRDKNLRTPLHLAILSGGAQITEALIHRGADLYAVDSQGCIPALVAARNLEVASCLSLVLAAMFPPIGETVSDNPFLRSCGTLITTTQPKVDSVPLHIPDPLAMAMIDPVSRTVSPSARPVSFPGTDADFF